MTPEFSRLLAKVVNSALFIKESLSFRNSFISRTSKLSSYTKLNDSDKKYVSDALQSIEDKDKVW